MKFNTVILFIVSIVICNFTIAQTAHRLSFGIQGGVNFQNLNGSDENGVKMKNGLIPGFNVGPTVEIPIAPDMYFQTAILLSTKGANIKNTISNPKVRLSYIEMPFHFLYKALLGNGHVLIGLGPYIAYGISAGTNNSLVKFKNTVEITDPLEVFYYNKFDAGADLFFGYEFSNSVSFRLNTQLGLLNIKTADDRFQSDKSTSKNTGFGLSLGYRF
ncbi:MAG: porin family protein [Saprospiraceae bacterium]